MRKISLFVVIIIFLVLACESSIDDVDQYFEPVQQQYKTIEIPIITTID